MSVTILMRDFYIDMDKSDLPECPECDENKDVESLGMIEYGADYEDSQWFEKCSWLPGYYCHQCECQFVTDDE